MKRSLLLFVAIIACAIATSAQGLKKVYDETINTKTQIDSALADATAQNKFVICQVGGNWCPWCLRFAQFIVDDAEIASLIEQNFVYIHVNYSRSDKSEATAATMARLGSPQRFGFPVFVVLDAQGKVLHIQDSSFLESGKSYDREKVLRFLRCWTPKALGIK